VVLSAAELASLTVSAGCIDDDGVAAYVDGALTAAETAAVEAHLSACEACRKDVSALAVVQTMSARADPSDALELIPGDRIGRYVLSAERARGAMSIVAVADDPELGREVAIKVLRPELSAQLLRAEARVMARLSHPNVVAVHDVGEHAGRVYVAMELVHGVDLRRWLAVEKRSWREVVGALIQAGRGVAAAHDAGIVHRDIKPENILCGPGDRVRVTDFGLASYTVDATTGVTGTPRYLAPEVWAGKPATVHSDQWSFCVTLYEALVGRPPFDREDMRELRTAIERGARGVPSSVPGPLRRIILRGLAQDPGARWTSMHEVVAELEAARRSRRRWLAAGGAVAALAFTAVYAIARSPENPCDVPPSLIDSVWSERAIASAFAASGQSHAADSARRAGEILGTYGQRWRTARIESCRDARVDTSATAHVVYEARTRCLDRRRDDLAALARALSSAPSKTVVDRAVEAALGLPPLATCEPAAIAAEVMVPLSPALEPRVAAIDRELAEVRAMVLGDGAAAQAIAKARALLAVARTIGYSPVVARAARLLAHLATLSTDHAATERELDEALVATAAAHDDRGTAEVWTDLITFLAMTRGTPERAIDLASLAQAAVVRVGSPGDLLARLDHARGIAALERGADDDALTALLAAREHEADPLDRAAIDIALGSVEVRLGHLPQARDRLTSATTTIEHELGPHHPQLGLALMSLGSLESDRGNFAGARPIFERSLALIRDGLGEQHVAYALALSNLGMAESHGGDPNQARAHLTLAIDRLAQLGHRDEFKALANLGNLERALGNVAAASAAWERALKLARDANDATSERVR